MWDFICENNLNLLLIALALFAAGGLLVWLLSPLIEKFGPWARAFFKAIPWYVSDKIHGTCTLPEHETGVGIIETEELRAERIAWEELEDIIRGAAR